MSDIIKLLPDHVANQIAAGEVVQRPASVVKELLENAIDSQATSIKLIIKDAGKALVQVIDNGIGRKQAEELQKMRPKKHKSRAIELTQKRLAIFEKQYNQPTYIHVIDLYEGENSIGTKVELLIPMIEI